MGELSNEWPRWQSLAEASNAEVGFAHRYPNQGRDRNGCPAPWAHRRVQGRRLPRSPSASVAARLARGSRSQDAAHAEADREPSAFRLYLLPPCFPGIEPRGGEAENDSEGPF